MRDSGQPEYQAVALPGGPGVAVATMPWARSVAVGLWLGVGGRHDPDAWSGIAHFIEHVLFKGTRRRSARQITEEIERVGGLINGYTEEETTSLQARVPLKSWEQALDVLLDMYLCPAFDPLELEREREVIVEEIGSVADRPDGWVLELLDAVLWPRHPLGRPLTGTRETVGRIGPREVGEFYGARYGLARLWLTVAGPLSLDQVLARLGAYDLSPRAVRLNGDLGAPAPALERAGPAVRIARRRTEQVHVAIGFPAFGERDERRHIVRLLNLVLGEGMSGRIWQELREQRGLVYQIGSAVSTLADAGSIFVQFAAEPGHLAEALRVLGAELARLAVEPPSDQELRNARDYVEGQLELGLESTGEQMNWLGEDLPMHGRVLTPQEHLAALGRVTPRDLQEAARLLFRRRQLALAAVGRVPAAETLLDLLDLP